MKKFEITKSGLYVEQSGFFDGPIEISNGHIKVQLWVYGQEVASNEKFGNRFELKDGDYRYGPVAKNGWTKNADGNEYRKDAVNSHETKF